MQQPAPVRGAARGRRVSAVETHRPLCCGWHEGARRGVALGSFSSTYRRVGRRKRVATGPFCSPSPGVSRRKPSKLQPFVLRENSHAHRPSPWSALSGAPASSWLAPPRADAPQPRWVWSEATPTGPRGAVRAAAEPNTGPPDGQLARTDRSAPYRRACLGVCVSPDPPPRPAVVRRSGRICDVAFGVPVRSFRSPGSSVGGGSHGQPWFALPRHLRPRRRTWCSGR